MPRYGYTQNEEELYIIRSLSSISKGRFLDIGAHDGITFSSTRRLWELGWTGVYVEPSPDVLPALIKNAGEHCKVFPVAIAENCGIMDFYSAGGDMLGTLSQKHVSLWEPVVNFRRVKVEVIDIQELSERAGTSFDFINIDVEGLNLEVFNQFDWKVWNPKCICVEYESHGQHITNVLTMLGYKLVYKSGENLVFSK